MKRIEIWVELNPEENNGARHTWERMLNARLALVSEEMLKSITNYLISRHRNFKIDTEET